MEDDVEYDDFADNAKRNYLSRLATANENRRWPRRDCSLCVGFLTTTKGVRSITTGQLWLHNVSEGGALASSKRTNIPDHFFIFLGAFQYFIGCSVVGRNGHELRLQFIQEQPTELVDILSRITDPFEFRDRIRLGLYGLPEQQWQESLVG